MKSVIDANTPPATPAATAEIANAVVRISVGSSPIDRLAVSESRTARIALPQGLALSRAYRTSDRMVRPSARNAISRSWKLKPNRLGVGMPSSPFQPPVRAPHSAAPCSTIKPNAIVTMAR